MNNNLNSKKIKDFSRSRLWGNYGVLISAIIVESTLIYVAKLMVNLEFSSAVLFLIASFIINLLSGLLISGRTYMYMNLVYENPLQLSDLFYGFTFNQNKAIMLQLVFAVTSFVSSIPILLWENKNELMKQHFNIWCISSIIILILALTVNIYLSQVFFLMHDFPERSVKQLINSSIFLMKGNVFKYIKLMLSFIPFLILGVITMFIPLLWVFCYIRASQAHFYRELISSHDDNE